MTGAVAAILGTSLTGEYPIILPEAMSKSVTSSSTTVVAVVSFYGTGEIVTVSGVPFWQADVDDGESYEIKAVYVSGEATFGTMDTWLSLNNSDIRSWGISNSSLGTKTGVIDVTIRNSVNTSISKTSRVTISATRITP
jgi:hypothetical protein